MFLLSRGKFRAGAVLVVGLGLVASACGGGTKGSASATTLNPSSGRGSGPVDVLYAGSLVDTMNNVVGPAFHTATGYTFTGYSGDSGALANSVKGKTQTGDVYISANPSKDVGLEGAANGNWVSWYATFATSPLVLGYNPNSRFAQDLKTEPWYDVVSQPGFLLGRTDPTTDPKGVLAVTALNNAATQYNLPALKSLATSSSDVFAENTLVGRLQAGQLDAGFFYGVEAAAANIRTVPIPGPTLEAVYTITVLNNAQHLAGANAFVNFLLGPQGAAALQKEGLVVESPVKVSGTAPTALQGVLSGQ
jgi:molybdate/tungstate transport system substrate-binding protein